MRTYTDRDYLRLYENAIQDENGCIYYGKSLSKNGYGKFRIGAENIGAHRAAYEMAHGPIPEGKTVDHLCHDATICAAGDDDLHRRCINPLHLQLLEHEDNRARDRLSTLWHRWTSVGDGHSEGVDGMYVYPNGFEQCHRCRALWARYWKNTEAYALNREIQNEKTRLKRAEERRARGARQQGVEQTHCTKGHEFTPENTTWDGPPNPTTGLRAKKCRTSRNEKYRAKHPPKPKRELCKRGHLLDYVAPDGRRACRTCRHEAVRRYNERKSG